MELKEFIKKLQDCEDYEGRAISNIEEDIIEYLLPDLIENNDTENVKYLIEISEISNLKLLYFIEKAIRNKNEEIYNLFLSLIDLEAIDEWWIRERYLNNFAYILFACIRTEDINKLKYFSDIKINNETILDSIINVKDSYKNYEFELIHAAIEIKNTEILNYLIIDNKLNLYELEYSNYHALNHFSYFLKYYNDIEFQKEIIKYFIEIGYKLTNHDKKYLLSYKEGELKKWILETI